ncbi:MAG: protein kinase [Myxococcota bacterium]
MSSQAGAPGSSVRRIGRYTILEDLAKGGMAQVFVAQKDGTPEICVLKQLLGELENHATAGKRFYREAHVASYLNHPNIARTIDAGFEDETFCIAMEFICGRDVESMMHLLMRQGRMLPYEVSIAVTLGVLEGLSYAHDAKDPEGMRLDLVHRDLSPRNIMLSFDGEVKIIDFGLARGKVDDFKTAPGMILGTLRYVSPEQAVADPIDRRSDLYSVSVVLYEMLTGRPLVSDGKPLEVLTEVVNHVPTALSLMNPHLPVELDAVLAKGLEKAPGDRWQSAAAFRDALREAAGPLAYAPEESLGQFVRSLFPKDQARSQRLTQLGRARFEAMERGGSEDELASLTRAVMPSELSAPDEAASRTRTGYVAPTELGMIPDAQMTRTVFQPTAMTVDEAGVATRIAGTDAPTLIPAIVDNLAATAVAVPFDDTRLITHVGPSRTPSSFVARPRRSSTPWVVGGIAAATAVGLLAVVQLMKGTVDPTPIPVAEQPAEVVEARAPVALPTAVARAEAPDSQEPKPSAAAATPAPSPSHLRSAPPRPASPEPSRTAEPAAPRPKSTPAPVHRRLVERLEALRAAPTLDDAELQKVIEELNVRVDKLKVPSNDPLQINLDNGIRRKNLPLLLKVAQELEK